ncbi:hypothetical protein J7L06_01905 [Candidatus Bathyarchaeota archaeon]|nr:hypothetical protein [Candidatus Bathyarchaeota archaeon]
MDAAWMIFELISQGWELPDFCPQCGNDNLSFIWEDKYHRCRIYCDDCGWQTFRPPYPSDWKQIYRENKRLLRKLRGT